MNLIEELRMVTSVNEDKEPPSLGAADEFARDLRKALAKDADQKTSLKRDSDFVYTIAGTVSGKSFVIFVEPNGSRIEFTITVDKAIVGSGKVDQSKASKAVVGEIAKKMLQYITKERSFTIGEEAAKLIKQGVDGALNEKLLRHLDGLSAAFRMAESQESLVPVIQKLRELGEFVESAVDHATKVSGLSEEALTERFKAGSSVHYGDPEGAYGGGEPGKGKGGSKSSDDEDKPEPKPAKGKKKERKSKGGRSFGSGGMHYGDPDGAYESKTGSLADELRGLLEAKKKGDDDEESDDDDDDDGDDDDDDSDGGDDE